MLMWLTMPFYDFCGFRSVAVNTVYKLQFFTFIFAVLLPVLSKLLILSITTTFSIFQDGSRHHLGFRNFKILTVRTFKGVELHLRTKFCQNRSNRSQDMAIFRFFKMAAAAILDFPIV